MRMTSSNVCLCNWIIEKCVMRWLTWGLWEGQQSHLCKQRAKQDNNPPHYQSPRHRKFFCGGFSVLSLNFTEFYKNQTPNSIKTPTHNLRTADQTSISLSDWITEIFRDTKDKFLIHLKKNALNLSCVFCFVFIHFFKVSLKVHCIQWWGKFYWQ